MAEHWKVVGQRQTSTVVAGSYVPAMEVSFETTRGDTGSVLIPLTQYSADAARTAIDARVATLDDVREL